MRLDKYLVECGVGSRSEIKQILLKKLIRVNGKITISSKEHVDEFKDEIYFMEKKMEYKEFRYYLMNKPSGYITATEDKKEKTVMEILPEWVVKKDLSPVGRLDKDTEGLLLFTNDGKLSHELLSPKKHVEKIYEVHLENEISNESIEKLESGVIILDGYLTKPAKVEKISDLVINLVISEGKFHQVKEMLKAVNNKVIYLKRIKFGNLELNGLKIGEVIEINKENINIK
ncbi:MAG: 16S rRNA pseudouridine(516) synthase [Fusobacteriaceae bacterium]|nr:16S rRNA pseudouridine(516) synthase [Fusobacteriaceae bacterium]